jgi:hypothetical protein
MNEVNQRHRECATVDPGTGLCSPGAAHDVLGSTIYIFERVVSCDELERVDPRRRRVTVAENERAILLELTAVWPPAARTVLKTPAAGHNLDPRLDQVDAYFNTGESGLAGFGTVTIAEATPTSGLISVELASDPSRDDRARGSVRVAVCP